MSKKMQAIGFVVIWIFLCFDNSYCSQPFGIQDDTLGQKQLEHVKIDAQSVGQLFSDISLIYNIPIGVQAALNDDESTIYHLELEHGTLSELLTRFGSQHPEYTWQIKDGVVRVFPSEGHRDSILVKLLAVQIESFTVAKNTSCSGFEHALFATTEIRKLLEANGVSYRERNFTGFYFPQLGEQFTLRAENETLESILNRVIRKSPTAKFWLVTKSKHDHAVLLTVNARQEVASEASVKH